MDRFSPGVWTEVNYYVYLLIDPRNNRIFYVGKGKDNRVFDHVNNALNLETEKDRHTAKIQTIRDIKDAGHDVKYVIHRHGMEEDVALEVEASLIDLIDDDDLTNEMNGIGVDRGPMTIQQIEQRYASEPMLPDEDHRLLFIVIKDGTLRATKSVYVAVKGHWKLGRKRASAVQYVLAMNRNTCIGIFSPDCWYDSKLEGEEGRLGFNGTEILSGEVFDRYHNKRWPAGFRKPGAQNPVMYYPKR